MSDLTPAAELTALQDLLSSEGWAIYMAHLAVTWGPAAMEDALRAAKAAATAEEWPHESTRILDAFAAMRANVRWPEARVRSLQAGEKTLAGKVADRFSALRRV